MYRNGLAAGLIDLGGKLYEVGPDGHTIEYVEVDGKLTRGPEIYNRWCQCRVNAQEVVDHDPTYQDKDYRAWAQQAVDIHNNGLKLRASLISEKSDYSQRMENFFDLAGKSDVAFNAVVGSFSEVFTLRSRQISKSRYWTSATKNTTLAFAKNLRRLGTAGIVAATFVSGYELYLYGGTGSAWARFGTGLVITGIGFIPYVGLPSAIILGAYEAEGGFDSFYEFFDNPNQKASVINGFTKDTMFDNKYPINKN